MENGAWEGIDEYIRPFLKQLNESENITTIYSCEGHHEGDMAYLFFNVNSIGWDKFWLKIMPELSQKFCVPFLENNPESALLSLEWYPTITDNLYNSGITIYCKFNNSCFRTWEEQKKIFWNIMQEVFLYNFSV